VASALSAAGLHPGLAKAVTAQMALETGSGRSINGNNIGNIKGGGSWGGQTMTLNTQEHLNGKDVTLPQSFRSYPTLADGINDYVRFISSNPRYKAALEAKNADEFFTEMKKAGYATDPNYVSKTQGVYDSIYGG